MTRMIWSNTNKDSDLVVSENNYRNSTSVARYKPIKIDKPIVEKTYFEQKIISTSSIADCFVGVIIEDVSISWATTITNAKKSTMYRGNGTVWKDGVSVASSLVAWVIGDVIGVTVDPILKKISFYKNNTLVTTVDYFTEIGKNVVGVSAIYTEGNVDGFFDADKLNYKPPSGYKPYGRILNKVLLLQENINEYYSIKPQTMSPTTVAPTMTSNTVPSGQVLASTQTNVTTSGAWRVFNRVEDAVGWQSLSPNTTGYIGYEFTAVRKIAKYAVRSGTVANISLLPKDWVFEGSDDDVDWTTLDTRAGQSWTTLNTDKEYLIEYPRAFKMYRLNISANNGHATLVGLNELKLFEEVSPQTLVVVPSNTETDYVDYGMNQSNLTTINLSVPFTRKETVNEDGDSTIDETNPFSIYDVFGYDEEDNPLPMSILYYSDDPDKTSADLEITANYSPLDEIDGNYEVVTWTDEDPAERILNLSALPTPQFIKQVNPNNISGTISEFLSSESFTSTGNSTIRYLLSSDKTTWKTWDGANFVNVDTSNMSNIVANGMKRTTLQSLTASNWEKWTSQTMYLGIYLEEDIRGKTKAHIDSISYKDAVPKESTQISDAKLYILNTVSTIDVTFAGSTLSGSIDDEDEGKVQYRVILNGANYYPSDGSFTPLLASPLNINLQLSNKDYNIDENNTIRIEFKDYWGTSDYWQTNFVGTYSGILFTDSEGKYYSTDIGEVLQHLDFGDIYAGQTTLEHEVVLKNTYGYPINNIRLYTKANSFPNGMKAQFGTNLMSFEAVEELDMNTTLNDGEEVSFYIRLSTQLGVTPPTIGEFDIVVVADRI